MTGTVSVIGSGGHGHGDIRALVDFLPKLYGDGTPPPITRWNTRTQDRALTLPWPAYDETVEGFNRSDRR